MQKNPRQLYWYCRTFLVLEYDYAVEHFEIKPDKVTFRLKADLKNEITQMAERYFT